MILLRKRLMDLAAGHGRLPAVSEPARYENEHFTGLERGELELTGATFLECAFESCDFSESDFSAAHFSGCRFDRCELAVINLTDTVLQEVVFEACRLSGVNFSVVTQGAIGMQAEFVDSDLSFCSFRSLDLTGCAFRNCLLREADYQRCELQKVNFDGCDLVRCVFMGNNLKEADLRTARNYFISAHDNRISGLRVSLPEALGLLAAIDVQVD